MTSRHVLLPFPSIYGERMAYFGACGDNVHHGKKNEWDRRSGAAHKKALGLAPIREIVLYDTYTYFPTH